MRLRYVLLAIVVVLLIAVGLGAGSIAWITGRALPETSGTLRVRGLQEGATVRRDVNGIAQISASKPHDLFMAQGYVHAQERMWQMEVWRHISSGRLAELFGVTGVRASDPVELRTALAAALRRSGPTLIEVPVGEMPSPWKFIHMPRIRKPG